MIDPLPFSSVRDQLLEAQRVLNPTLKKPIINSRALLALSCPCSSIEITDDQDMTAMEFFGLYWVTGAHGDYGWFTSEHDAVEHMKALLTG